MCRICVIFLLLILAACDAAEDTVGEAAPVAAIIDTSFVVADHVTDVSRTYSEYSDITFWSIYFIASLPVADVERRETVYLFVNRGGEYWSIPDVFMIDGDRAFVDGYGFRQGFIKLEGAIRGENVGQSQEVRGDKTIRLRIVIVPAALSKSGSVSYNDLARRYSLN